MKHINLICLGRLKENFWQLAEAEYLKRLQPFAKIKIIELREESFSEKDNPETVKQKEADKILAEIKKLPDNFLVIMDSTGKELTSEQLAQQIFSDRNIADDKNNLTFIIGGPLGLHDSIMKLSGLKLSLSRLTFTHQMARVILWEQIYRAQMINANRNYHY